MLLKCEKTPRRLLEEEAGKDKSGCVVVPWGRGQREGGREVEEGREKEAESV